MKRRIQKQSEQFGWQLTAGDYSYNLAGPESVPHPDNGAVALHDLVRGFPEDVYVPPPPGVHKGRKPYHVNDEKVLNTLVTARGNPEATVKVYRAVPDEVTEINQGDYVTPSLSYAYSMLHLGPTSRNKKVIVGEVPAGHVYVDPRHDPSPMLEWGYHGPGMRGNPAPAYRRRGIPGFTEDIVEGDPAFGIED